MGKMNFDLNKYPYSVVEYINYNPPLTEVVPTCWLYDGKVTTEGEKKVLRAQSYYPVQIAKVEPWVKSKRNPGGTHNIVDSTLWEKNIPVIILKFCCDLLTARKKREKATVSDNLDTTDMESKKRTVKPPNRLGYDIDPPANSSDEELQSGPKIKKLKIQSAGAKASKGPSKKKGSRQRLSSSESDTGDTNDIFDKNPDMSDTLQLLGNSSPSPIRKTSNKVTTSKVLQPSPQRKTEELTIRSENNSSSPKSRNIIQDKTLMNLGLLQSPQVNEDLISPSKTPCREKSKSPRRNASGVRTTLSSFESSPRLNSSKLILTSSERLHAKRNLRFSPTKCSSPKKYSYLAAKNHVLMKEFQEMKNMLIKLQATVETVFNVVAPPIERPLSHDKMPELPLTDLDAFDEWNKYLETENNFYAAVHYFASKGKSESRPSVYAMLKDLLTDELATGLNMDGKNSKNSRVQKKGFASTLSFKMLKVAMKKHVNQHNKNRDSSSITLLYNSTTIKDDAGRWLKDSVTRRKHAIQRMEKSKQADSDTPLSDAENQ